MTDLVGFPLGNLNWILLFEETLLPPEIKQIHISWCYHSYALVPVSCILVTRDQGTYKVGGERGDVNRGHELGDEGAQNKIPKVAGTWRNWPWKRLQQYYNTICPIFRKRNSTKRLQAFNTSHWGAWGCATGWSRIFMTGLTILGLPFQEFSATCGQKCL